MAPTLDNLQCHVEVEVLFIICILATTAPSFSAEEASHNIRVLLKIVKCGVLAQQSVPPKLLKVTKYQFYGGYILDFVDPRARQTAIEEDVWLFFAIHMTSEPDKSHGRVALHMGRKPCTLVAYPG
ncbi:uncharacterized protein Bfra_003439 [Botrytis fragariae]|uniref:Uncharacterized protein n=1 Tax=Botrytis fragariae TaxID=1964551 RepID=A0A8H6AWP0_9HELO|nr:uncharacterized protein Bfra_003439 [Botrytis fragariae]KAF5874986.1 hypothetical protein Bfra_003439 [Botrytis fragariae]